MQIARPGDLARFEPVAHARFEPVAHARTLVIGTRHRFNPGVDRADNVEMSGLSGVMSTATAGLSAASQRLASAAQAIASPGGVGSLPQSVVSMDMAGQSFKADALVLKSADQMLGSLLDVLDTTGRPPG